ncbi:MAG: VOC family protein [Dermatophilaceae bacterium]
MTLREDPLPDGTHSSAEHHAADSAPAHSFYADLFGWEVRALPSEASGHLMADQDGHVVAGIGVRPKPELPLVWSTYLSVDDADATVAKITAAGGRLLVAPVDVPHRGRMAFAADPTGAGFGIWQDRSRHGADRDEEHGPTCWNECHTRDYLVAQSFYADVFGWSFDEIGDGSYGYSIAKRAGDGEGVGGIHQLGDEIPEGIDAYWLAWFSVGDCDAVVKRAVELGASVRLPPMDSPFGRMAGLAGPHGEIFGVIDAQMVTPVPV